jgi:sugar phosphate isomerase/epimerase
MEPSTSSSEPRPLILWSGTVRGAGYAELIDAAVAGGFAGVSMLPTDYRAARAAGWRDADLRALAADRGVRVAVLDPYARWLPRWEPPPGLRAEHVELMATDEAELLAMAEALGVASVSVVEPFGAEYETGELAESFAAFCDRAAERGLAVQLEFVPFTGVRDLTAAWDVVRLADRPNGGLLIDVWHYFRSRSDGGLLARIPGERIHAVQVCDAAAEPVGGLVRDSLRHRSLPGEGDLDVVGLLSLLVAKPGLGAIGLEVFSEELWRLEPTEIGRRGGAALRRTLARARSRAAPAARPPGERA